MENENSLPQVHVLVDLENNQPTLDQVRGLVPDLTRAWLFHSPQQAAHLASYKVLGEKHAAIPLTRPGKNSLDFHLAFYVGYLAARYPEDKLVVIAIDHGYGPMVEHANELGLNVACMPFAKSVAPKKKVAAKKAPAKKAAAKKVAGKSAPAKKLATKSKTSKAGAGKAPARKQPISKAPVHKRSPAKQPAAKAVKPAPKAAPSAAVQPKKQAAAKAPLKLSVQQVIARLKKMGSKRPVKLASLQRYLAAQMGCDEGDVAVSGMFGSLAAAGALRVEGSTVTYGPAVAGG